MYNGNDFGYHAKLLEPASSIAYQKIKSVYWLQLQKPKTWKGDQSHRYPQFPVLRTNLHQELGNLWDHIELNLSWDVDVDRVFCQSSVLTKIIVFPANLNTSLGGHHDKDQIDIYAKSEKK